jgi:uncharacterized protein GlcG (DUF336 family)
MEAIIMKHQRGLSMGLAAGVVAGAWLVAGRSHVSEARADERPNAPAQDACAGLPDNARLARALKLVVHGDKNGGSGNEMWGGVVNRDGVVCSIAFSGNDRGAQFPGSRVIAAAKANTANAFSLPKNATSSGNLYAAVQPGGPIFGLENGNPVDTTAAYQGDSAAFGTADDPLVGQKVGGTIVFGGGLALYDTEGRLLGAVGVSGDSSCADHIIAWETRSRLNLDNVPGGGSPTHDDNLVIGAGGHPDCGSGSAALIAALPHDFPIGPKR